MALSRNARLSLAAAGGALLLHTVNGSASALMGAFPASLDELQHVSLIRTLEAGPRLFPAYDSLRDLDPRTLRFTAQANYLNHPSPYYLFMGLVDRAAHGSILALRLTDLALSTLAVVIMLVAAFRVLTGWKERALFALLLVLFPKLGAVAGLINNDNAALVATAVAFLGLVEWQRRPSPATGLLLAAGLALSGWTKLTVFLMAGFAVVIAEGLRIVVGCGRRATSVAYGALAAGLAIGAAPTLVNVLSYGRVLHHSTAQAVPLALRVHLSFGRYALIFLGNMVAKWAAVEPSTVLQVLGLALVLGLATAAVGAGSRRLRGTEGDRAAAWRAAIGLMAATLPVLVLHLYFGWRTYVEDGFVDMAQARYYYGVWPGFALGLALLWRIAPPGRTRDAITALTVTLLAVASVAVAGAGLLIHGHPTIS